MRRLAGRLSRSSGEDQTNERLNGTKHFPDLRKENILRLLGLAARPTSGAAQRAKSIDQP